jgi:serine/threonine protein kinase
LAPEQARNSHNVDSRADIYSLGCTLYYLLTGHAPFPEGTLAQRILQHQSEAPSEIRKERPDCPQSLIAICNKMMAKKPEGRYQTAEEVAIALEHWLVDQGREVVGGDLSGDSSGSFPGLAVAVATEGELRGGTTHRNRPRRASRRDSGIGSPKKLTSRDTISDRVRETVKGLPSDSDAATLSKGKPLPVAKSLDDEGARPDSAVIDLGQDVFGEGEDAKTLLDERRERAKRGRAKAPIWIWAVLGLSAIVAIGLIIYVAVAGLGG